MLAQTSGSPSGPQGTSPPARARRPVRQPVGKGARGRDDRVRFGSPLIKGMQQTVAMEQSATGTSPSGGRHWRVLPFPTRRSQALTKHAQASPRPPADKSHGRTKRALGMTSRAERKYKPDEAPDSLDRAIGPIAELLISSRVAIRTAKTLNVAVSGIEAAAMSSTCYPESLQCIGSADYETLRSHSVPRRPTSSTIRLIQA
ncbi:hypothetical protein PSPO01_05341 [Paraphaeosphaeria sporulosa]